MYLYKMYAVVCTTTRVCYPRALSLSLSKCAKNITRVFECRPFVASRRTFRFFFFNFLCTNDPLRRFNTTTDGAARGFVLAGFVSRKLS